MHNQTEVDKKAELLRLRENHQHNIADNAKAITGYLKEQENVEVHSPQIPQSINSIQDMSTAIMELQCQRDFSQNITWTVSKHPDGTNTLIRDARLQTAPMPMSHQDSFKIQYIASLRAAIDLLDDEVKKLDSLTRVPNSGITATYQKQVAAYVDDRKSELYAIATRVVKGELQVSEKNIAEVNTALANYLTVAGVENSDRKLETAREFGSFYDTHHHVSTITQVKNGKGEPSVLIESEVAALGNTPAQKMQYQAIQDAMAYRVDAKGFQQEQIFKDVKCEGQDMSWFNKLPVYQKQLILNHIDTLIDGSKVVPTQLRKVLPGIRNAHTKSTYVQQPGEDGLTLAVSTAHIGTPSFHPKHLKEKEAQKITTENLIQAQAIFAGPDNQITCNILNSPINPTGIDKSIERQVKKGIETLTKLGNQAVSSVTTPFNILRTVSSNDISQFDKNLKTIAKGVCGDNPELKAVRQYLEGKGSHKKAMAALENNTIVETDIKQLLKVAVEARHGINTSRAFRDPENTNLKIVAAMKQVTSLANDPNASDKMKECNLKLPVIVTNCASGKDRTGVAEFETSRQAANQILGVKAGSTIEQENMKQQARAGHTQTMASVNGGTRGCDGIKKDTVKAMPKKFYESIREGLMQFTASYNKFKCIDDKLVKQENSLCPKADKELAAIGKETKGKHAQKVLEGRGSGGQLTRQ